MFQLKYDNDFNDTIKDIPHWNDIPCNIKDYITETSDKRVIYESTTGYFFCGKCVCHLDENNYCKNCDIHHQSFEKNDLYRNGNKNILYVDEVSSERKYLLDDYCHYFVFDIIDGNVYLYHILEEISYDNPFYANPFKTSQISIVQWSSFLIEKDGITNIYSNEYTSFKDLDYCRTTLIKDFEEYEKMTQTSEIFKFFDTISIHSYNSYLYIENLFLLSQTVYRYSKIWKMKEYLENLHGYSVIELSLNPLYYSSYEYLINYSLFDLAWNTPHRFIKGKNFKEIFGVDKKHLPFMAKNNISYAELEILRLCPCDDIEVLRYYGEWYEVFFEELKDLVINIKLNLKTLKRYLDTQNLPSNYIGDFLDYIDMAKKLGLDISQKQVLYPSDLEDAHYDLLNQIEISEDSEMNEKIKNIANLLSINNYEDKNYIIYPAASMEDLVDESKQQKNCVRTYCEKITNGECQIYFMRKKNDKTKSFVTIEVKNNRVIQARIKYNELPSKDIIDILKKWEESLIHVTID